MNWIVGAFPGTLELLADLRAHGRPLACLSNCNAVHWPRLVDLGIVRAFDEVFLSHELGLAKPDPALFAEVGRRLGRRPFFLDDNAVNVEAAVAAGWEARIVRGPHEARVALRERGFLPGSG